MDTGYQGDARMNIAVNQINYNSLHCIFSVLDRIIRRMEMSHFIRRYHKAFNMRERFHACTAIKQDYAPFFGPCVRPNAACISRWMHIVDNITCLC